MAQRYDLVTPREGKDGKTYWTKVGVAFPNRNGDGFSLSLEAYPLPNKEGEVRMIMRPPMERDAEPQPRRGSTTFTSGRQPAPNPLGGQQQPTPQRVDDDIPF